MEESKPVVRSKTGGVFDIQASTKGLDIIITGAIMLIFFLCPLFFTGMVAQGIGFEKMVLFYFLVLLGTVAWVTKGVIAGELNLKRTPLDYPIIATVVIYALSVFFSVSVKDSLIGSYGNPAKGFVAICIFALFYYLVINNIDTKKIKLIFWSLVTSSSIMIVYSLLQFKGWYILPFDFAKSPSFNPLGSVSGLSTFIAIILPLLVIAAAQVEQIFPGLKKAYSLAVKIFFIVITVGGLVILGLLNGFTFWPVTIVSIVIVLMFFLSKIIKISNNNLLIPLFVFLALIILLVLGNFNVTNLNLPAEISLSRGASWDIAQDSLKAKPILGSGPSTFYYSFSKFKSPDFNASPLWNVRFDNASGSLFELIATVGVLGALAVIVLALIALSISFLSLIKTSDKEVNSIMLALSSAFVSAVLYSLLFAQSNSLILMIIIIAVFAVGVALVIYPERFQTLKLSFRASPKYALALAAIFLCVSAGVVVVFTMGLKMYMADYYARQSLVAADLNQKVEKLNQAIGFAPYQDAYYISLANNYMGLANQSALSGNDTATIGENLSKAIEAGKKAVDIAPNNGANNESLALIYENASFYTRGALEWAENLYKKDMELDPNNPVPHLRMALVNMARANVETDQEEQKFYINEAIKKYDEAIVKKEDLAPAYYGKAVAQEKLSNLNDAIEQLKKANLIDGNNLDYRFELGRLYFNRGVSQPDLSQSASNQITENAISPEGQPTGDQGDQVSVQPTQGIGGTTGKNEDLSTAEQLFLSILAANNNHANARYSLAVLYQKVGETDKAKIMVKSLLDIIQDEPTKEAVKKQFPGLY